MVLIAQDNPSMNSMLVLMVVGLKADERVQTDTAYIGFNFFANKLNLGTRFIFLAHFIKSHTFLNHFYNHKPR